MPDSPAHSPAQQQKKSYKDTLNLPRTAFAMKASLVQNEPASLKRWTDANLYNQLRQARKNAPRYVFHDGPPYANGAIHLGHLLNKVLKDFVVRSKTMAGLDVPYIPGWDCHGLPIEHKVVLDLADKARSLEPFQIRRKCKDSAEKFIKLQKTQMHRLLTLADYDHPYLTMDPAYEAAVLEVFAELVKQNLVYRALKPVHWSIENQTALAEAELEYYDRQDTSVYVLFELTNPEAVFQTFGKPGAAYPGVKMYLMIWTTTPWTLPANMAIAVNTSYDYALLKFDEKYVIVASELADKVMKLGGVQNYEQRGKVQGIQLEGIGGYKHPFIENQTSPVVFAEYVTLEDGTGLVHTAPGHGVEDYRTGLGFKLHFYQSKDGGRSVGRGISPQQQADIYCPVKEDGTFDHTAPDWLQGKTVWQANDLVIEKLRASGHLFHAHKFTHSYPHDWRGKTPVIFRATKQWFVGVDKPLSHQTSNPQTLRQRAISATEQIKFFPEWGRNRMRGMLESRPDWCISRQRSWGLPIPAFYNEAGDELLTPALVRAVAANFRKHGGSDYWFKATPAELLHNYDVTADPDAPAWAKEGGPVVLGILNKSTDIFDVWFESGSSWHAVIRQRFGNAYFPTDLYLEGSDQHRGWFQSSLLPALGATGQAPFKAVLTHGFMVDKDGRKMSKSLGNALEVDSLLKEHGADVCRWWVSSINTDNDIKVDPEFFKLAGEEYRKVRNTIRYLLSNLYDFNPAKDKHPFTAADATTIDAWALSELSELIATARKNYDDFNFPRVQESIFNFCNETMSAVYLAATKDRLYCDPAASPRRRRTQTALWQIADALIRLIAPILPHTADEAWAALHSQTAAPASVHLELFPQPVSTPADPDWPNVMAQRHHWLKALEDARNAQSIDNPLDMGLAVPHKDFLAKFNTADLADLCMISRFDLAATATEISVRDLRSQPRCERSWKRDASVKPRSDGGTLSDRDAAALGLSAVS